jgi:hypothetical protein
MNIRLFRLQEKLQALKDREEDLLLEFQGVREKQGRLLELNLQQQREFQKKLTLEQAFYHALFGKDSPIRISNEVLRETVIAMPYCVLVDFNQAVIYVKYHESIFNEVKNHESPSIQMVNKDICICKDFE